MKVLIADDDDDARLVQAQALKACGYSVVTACDGAQALEKAKQQHLDLIISDILMPKMDGFALCREIKHDPALRGIPFMFYTATYIEPEDEALALAMGATRFVVKPQEIAEYLKVVEETLNSNQTNVESNPDNDDEIEHLHLERLTNKLSKKVHELDRKQHDIRAGEERYRHIFEDVGVALWELDFTELIDWLTELRRNHLSISAHLNTPEGIRAALGKIIVVGVNPATMDLFDAKNRGQLLGPLLQNIPEEAIDAYRAQLMAFAEGKIHFVTETPHRTLNNKPIHVLMKTNFPLRPENHRRVLISMFDVTARQQTHNEYVKLWQAVEQSPVSVIITDADGHIEYVNPKFCEITGYSSEDVIGKTPRILKSGEMQDAVYDDIWQTISKGNEWRGELSNKKKNGELYWEHVSISPIKLHDNITHYVAVKEDISVRKAYEERLLEQANFDSLTGLPNRILALDRLSQAILREQRDNGYLALLFIDLDHFKNINDSQGHFAGDQLLVQASTRLKNCVRNGDTVARLGGDEFLVILSHLESLTHAEVVTEKLLEEFGKPFVIDHDEYIVTASIGIATYPVDGSDPQILMKNADVAMYKAKNDGRNTYRFFTREMNEHVVKRLEMESCLRHALENNEFTILAQPLIHLRTSELVGSEVLLRWKNEQLGNTVPDIFIPLAEETGLIVDIGRWVLQNACMEAKAWQDVSHSSMSISVNVSSRQFRDPGFIMVVTDALQTSALPPACLSLEITERLLLEDDPTILRQFNALKALGVRLVIDDFGTGYSSLSYLRKFPFDALKIDKSFTQSITENDEAASVAAGIIALAQSLNLEVTGEGVETREQLELLRDYGCQIAQGFYFSEPLPFSEFRQLSITRQASN